jgi:sugar phosphate permease
MVGLQGPVMAGLLHSRVDSSVRATMMSVESLALQAGGAVANVAVGALAAAFGLIGGFGFVAAAGLVAGFLLVRDLASASPEAQ